MKPRSGFAIIVAILALAYIGPAAALEPWRDTTEPARWVLALTQGQGLLKS